MVHVVQPKVLTPSDEKILGTLKTDENTLIPIDHLHKTCSKCHTGDDFLGVFLLAEARPRCPQYSTVELLPGGQTAEQDNLKLNTQDSDRLDSVHFSKT